MKLFFYETVVELEAVEPPSCFADPKTVRLQYRYTIRITILNEVHQQKSTRAILPKF